MKKMVKLLGDGVVIQSQLVPHGETNFGIVLTKKENDIILINTDELDERDMNNAGSF